MHWNKKEEARKYTWTQMMRVSVDNLENSPYGHINDFDLCVQSEKLEKNWKDRKIFSIRAT